MKSVRNAIRALELFSEESPEISVSRVSEHLGIPKSSASRMLAAMKDGGIVEQEPRTRQYRPAAMALRLGTIYSAKSSSRDLIRAAMRQLAVETRHSCWMLALSGTDIVVLDGIHGGYPIRLVVEPGSRLPAHATAAGKALLSRLDDDKVRAMYPGGQLKSFTKRTLPTVDHLIAELRTIRKNRWAQTRQEVIDGIVSISVAFQPSRDMGLTALSVSFPVSIVAEDEERVVRNSLLRISEGLGRKLDDTYWK